MRPFPELIPTVDEDQTWLRMASQPIRFLKISIVIANYAWQSISGSDASVIENVIPGDDVVSKLRLGQVDNKVERCIRFGPSLERKFLNLGWRQVGDGPVKNHIGGQRRFNPSREFGEKPGP